MDEETIVRLMQSLARKLVGKVSAYGKYTSKYSFLVDMKTTLTDFAELLAELEKEVEKE